MLVCLEGVTEKVAVIIRETEADPPQGEAQLQSLC